MNKMNKMNKMLLIFVTSIVIIWLVLIGALLVLPGCTVPNGGQTPPIPPQDSISQTITQIVYKTNWLSTLAIVGIALSAAAFVQGAKFALPMFVGCATLLATILTITQYAKWIAFVGFGIAMIVFIYITWQKRKEIGNLNTAFKEVVTGAQNLKQKIINNTENTVIDLKSKAKAEINKTLAEIQSDSTVALVNKVKDELGLKTTIGSEVKVNQIEKAV